MAEPSDQPEPRKRKTRKRKLKPRGVHVAVKKQSAPFRYDAKPVLKMHIGPGRPTDYHALRGDEVIGHMASGLSITASAAMMGFAPETIYEWARRHPEFAAALKRGKACRALYLERKLYAAIDGPSVTAAIFGLKNAAPAEWRDKHEITTRTAEDDPLLAFLRSIDGRVLKPVTPAPVIDVECSDVTVPAPLGNQVDGPPRPIGGPGQ